MEHINAILDGIGGLYEGDSRTRGGILLSAVAALSVGYVTSLFRRRPQTPVQERVKVTVDAPKGEHVSVRIGGSDDEKS